jgi:hypothetical protein
MNLPRVWFNALDLEEFQAGMWRKVASAENKRWLELASNLLQDSEQFRFAMFRVFDEWPNSSLYNFTNPSLNKPVWLAHAGACLSRNIPEQFMRHGYCLLPKLKQIQADKDAIEVADKWEDPRIENTHIGNGKIIKRDYSQLFLPLKCPNDPKRPLTK